MISLIQAIKTSVGTDLVIINTNWSRTNYLAEADGMMDENYGHANWEGPTEFLNVTSWLNHLNALITAQSNSKYYFAQSGVYDGATEAQINKLVRYCYASFLMGVNSNGYGKNYFVPKGSYPAYTDKYWYTPWEWALGNPTGAYGNIAGKTNLYKRNFDKGFVIVNPKDTGDSYSFGSYYYNENWELANSVSLEARQGAVFFLDSTVIDLVTKYYNDILDRAPEPGGAESWTAEIDRIMSMGIDLKEGFIAIGKVFFNSPEYLSMGKTDEAYVLDLYRTFLNRIPSQPEVDSWLDVLAQGVTRNVVLNFFVFSPEYNTYMGGLFGASTARPENNLVNDFYRGILSRLPDTMGFNYWLGLMRTAQCTGEQQVRDLSYQIASLFVGSAEYEARGRTNSGFVEDLYDAILRRTAAPWEINYWFNELNTKSRLEVLQGFTGSAEFQTRVTAVIDAGCL